MRKIQLTTLVAACLLLVASSAFAFGEIAYPDRPLNLRASRSPKAAWIGSLYPGQEVRIAHEKDGWVAIYEPGETDSSEAAAVGFSNAKYLKKTRGRYEPVVWGELVYTPRTLNVRSKPSVKGNKVGSLHAMEHVLIDFPEDDWTMVFAPDATIRSQMNAMGYCAAKYFQPATQESKAKAGLATGIESSVQEVSEVPSGSGQVSGAAVAAPDPVSSEMLRVVLTAKVNVRQSRTSSSPLVRTLKPNDIVQIGLLRNGWYAVFSANDMIRSESSSIGYALQSLIDKATSLAPIAKPVPAPVAASAPEAVTLEAIKSEAVRPEAAAPAPEPVAPMPATPEPVASEPVPAPPPAAVPTTPKQQTMVIDRSAFAKSKRPDPTPNQTAHGYQYRLVEKSESRQFGENWITLKVFLSTSKLPGRDALKDFAVTLWKDHKRVTKKLVVLIYLPGMDMENLAYGVIKFDDEKMLELWVRKATLFGTKFI